MPAQAKGQDQELLEDAVARNAAIVLSLPSAGLVRNLKSRFLGGCEEGIWIEIPDSGAALVKGLSGNHHQLAVSFKVQVRRVSFVTAIDRIEDAYRVNAETTVAAFLIARPKNLKSVQRRAAYRVRVYQDSDIRVRAWMLSEHTVLLDRPSATQEIKVELRDVSLGGIGVKIVSPESLPHPLVEGLRIRVQLEYNDIDLLLDGRLRNPPPTDGSKQVVTGIVFKILEADLEGRQKLSALTRIIGEMHREEVRRTRLGLAS